MLRILMLQSLYVFFQRFNHAAYGLVSDVRTLHSKHKAIAEIDRQGVSVCVWRGYYLDCRKVVRRNKTSVTSCFNWYAFHAWSIA